MCGKLVLKIKATTSRHFPQIYSENIGNISGKHSQWSLCLVMLQTSKILPKVFFHGHLYPLIFGTPPNDCLQTLKWCLGKYKLHSLYQWSWRKLSSYWHCCWLQTAPLFIAVSGACHIRLMNTPCNTRSAILMIPETIFIIHTAGVVLT